MATDEPGKPENGEKRTAPRSSRLAAERPSTTERGPAPVGAVLSDPRSGPPLISARSRLWAGFWREVGSILVSLGLRRQRNDDGTLQPRNWRRLGILTGVVVAIIFVWTSVHVVAPGNVAVPVTLGHEGKALDSGIHITWPLTVTYNMSTRTQAYTMTSLKNEGPNKSTAAAVTVLGADGGAATVDATVLYRVAPGQASKIYRTVGRDYTTKIVRPSARNCIRTEFTRYPMVQAATGSWTKLAANIEQCMRAKLLPVGLVLQDFQLREVTLSSQLATAVNLKVAAQQKEQQQQFELGTARTQADISRVTAKATADAQQLVACGGRVDNIEQNGRTVQVVVPNPSSACEPPPLTQTTLSYLYIQALQSFAASGNSNSVILPYNQNIAPLITVNPGQGTTAPSAPTVPTPTTTPGPSRAA